jgi:hypothetical protein
MTDVDPTAGEPEEEPDEKSLPDKPPIEIPDDAEDAEVDPLEVPEGNYLDPEDARNDPTVDDAEEVPPRQESDASEGESPTS